MKKIYFRLAHVFIFGWSLCLFVATFQYDVLFNYHPPFMVLAFVLCMSEGVMCSRYIKSKERAKYIQIHLVLMALSVAFSSVGLLSIVLNKYNHGKFHLTSWHSWLGLLVLFNQASLSVAGLLLHYKRKNIIYLGGIPLYQQMAMMHANVGAITHTLSALCIAQGFFYTNYGLTFSAPFRFTVLGSMVLLSLIVLLMKPAPAASSSSGSQGASATSGNISGSSSGSGGSGGSGGMLSDNPVV